MPQAAEALGIHRTTAYKLVKDGEFPVPVIRVGKQMKVATEQIDHFLRTGEALV